MTEVNRENLSAGMDGQLSSEELRFLLRRFEADASLAKTWGRYHVARDGLRRELAPMASADFADRVMRAIEQETGVSVVPQARRRWLRWSAGGAIAASVAVAALLVTQPAGQEGGEHTSPLAAAGSGNAAPSTITQTIPLHNEPTPAQAPAWLNSYASLPSQLSQQASATVDGNEGPLFYSHSERLWPYQVPGYRVVNQGNGSYLLISPERAARQQPLLPQARAVAQ